MSSVATHRTHQRTVLSRDVILKALPSSLPVGDEFAVASVLSLPVPDLAGDIVHADRFTFAAHQADPYVDFEHGRHPEVGKRPVGWARPTYHKPGGAYSVLKARLNVPGAGWRDLPIGVTYFDRDDPLQRQVCFGVRDGQWSGVSLEFLPDWTVAKSRGFRSPVDTHRNAYEFTRADVVRWTHCVEAVCDGAGVVLKSRAPDALAKTLRDGTIRGERLHPVILKALDPYRTTTVSAPVGKAMPDTATADTPATPYDPALPEDDSGPANNGVSALLAHAQACVAAAEQLEADLENTDSPQIYRDGKKLVEEMRKLAEKAKGLGDKHDAKLQDMKNGTQPAGDDTDAEEGDEKDTDDDADSDDAEPDMEEDEEGGFKAVRQCYKPILKARRQAPSFSLDQIIKGIADVRAQNQHASGQVQPDPEHAAAQAELDRQKKKFAKTMKTYG